MIKTANPGILEAIREVKTMNLGKRLWQTYEAHLKAKRDARARDEYVRDEGIQIGMSQGILLTKDVWRLSSQGLTVFEISRKLHVSAAQVEEILKD